MKYTIALFICQFTFCFNSALAQTKEINAIDSIMDLCIQNNCFNGDVSISVDNNLFYKKTIGFRDNANKEKLDPNLVFNIGSVSKPFTAVAILQLQEKKLLNINDKVIKYIPTFPYSNICIKHLLSHTSGIVGNIDFLDSTDQNELQTNDSIIGLLNKYKPTLLFEPGSQWAYSNLGYEILAVLVEQVSKMKFNEYMTLNIFQPAKMSKTFVAQTHDIKQWLPKGLTEKDIALPHDFENIASCTVKNIYSEIINSKGFFYGSTHVYTSVSDLTKFDQALSEYKILKKSSQQLAYTPFQLSNGNLATDTLSPILSYYGLGWEISIDTSWGKIIWHKGRSGGTRAVFLRNVDKKQVVIFLDNNDNPNTDLKAIAALKIINHQPYKNPINMSLVQKFGCEINTKGYAEAYQDFLELKETKKQYYFYSKYEMDDLANTLDKQNDLKDALAVSKLCNENFVNFWEGLLTNGDLLLKAKHRDEAILCYKKTVPLYSDNEENRVSLLGIIGSQFIDKNRLEDAEIVLKLNTELFPEDCNSYDNYAYILDKNNKLDQAIAVQEKAVALATSQNHTLLGVLQENLKNLKAKK